MSYVDGFLFSLPKKNVALYKKIASKAGKIWMKYGALAYFECEGDDLNPNMGMEGMKTATFPKTLKIKPNEAIIFSFIIYKSKAHRDKVNAKVMKDPAMDDPSYSPEKMPFDMEKMNFGGFKPIVRYTGSSK